MNRPFQWHGFGPPGQGRATLCSRMRKPSTCNVAAVTDRGPRSNTSRQRSERFLLAVNCASSMTRPVDPSRDGLRRRWRAQNDWARSLLIVVARSPGRTVFSISGAIPSLAAKHDWSPAAANHRFAGTIEAFDLRSERQQVTSGAPSDISIGAILVGHEPEIGSSRLSFYAPPPVRQRNCPPPDERKTMRGFGPQNARRPPDRLEFMSAAKVSGSIRRRIVLEFQAERSDVAGISGTIFLVVGPLGMTRTRASFTPVALTRSAIFEPTTTFIAAIAAIGSRSRFQPVRQGAPGDRGRQSLGHLG